MNSTEKDFLFSTADLTSMLWNGNGSDDGKAATGGASDIPPLRLLMSAFMFVVVIISFLANLFVLLSFMMEKKLRTTFTALIANLAMTDLLVAVAAMDFYTIDVMYGYWPFSRVLCGIWVVCDYSTVFASCFTLAAISIDRLWSIKWAINYRQYNNMKKSTTIITVIWVTVVGIVWYPIISDRVLRTRDGVCKYVPDENPQFVIALAILGHHTPCTVIVVSYVIVYREMKKLLRVRPTTRHTNNGHTTSAEARHTNNAHTTSAEARHTNNAHTTSTEARHTNNAHTTSTEARHTNNAHTTSAEVAAVISHQVESVVDANSRSIAAVTGELGRGEGGSGVKTTTNTTNTTGTSGSNRAVASDGHKQQTRDERERKTFVTLSYIVLCYIVCWLPFHIVYDLSIIAPQIVPESLFTYTFWLTYVNSTLNPFLYAFSSNDLRSAFKDLIRCRIRH